MDFLVTRKDQPWFLVEAKTGGNRGLNPALSYFQSQTGAKHAFQLAFDLAFVGRDCFEFTKPMIIPASSFLSQLV